MTQRFSDKKPNRVVTLLLQISLIRFKTELRFQTQFKTEDQAKDKVAGCFIF